MTMPDTARRPRIRLPEAIVPDVARAVRLHGAPGTAEVGGGACFGLLVAIARQ